MTSGRPGIRSGFSSYIQRRHFAKELENHGYKVQYKGATTTAGLDEIKNHWAIFPYIAHNHLHSGNMKTCKTME